MVVESCVDLYIDSMLAGQAEYASKCDGSATGIVQTKLRRKATHVFISQGTLWLQRRQDRNKCELYPTMLLLFFSSTQPTSRALRTDGRCSSSYLWCHVCCLRMFSVHVQKRPCPPPFIPRLGLFLGLWHLQCQPKCRLPEQLASPLQWSNPRGVGKRLHKGSSRELPLGTAITLEKWFFRNLNITFPLAFFWCLELSSHSLLFTWYGIVLSFRKLLCFALL